MDYKKSKAPVNTVTRNIMDLCEETGNIYESVAIIAKRANQISVEIKRHFQELVFKTVIQRNVKLSESPSHGLPVILYDADSAGAKNHLSLAKEIIEKNK